MIRTCLAMGDLVRLSVLLVLPLLFFVGAAPVVAADEVITAPMEKTERDALYSAIQGFVGKAWNGSALYPDPCGWTPIQGVSCDLFDGLWYVTELGVGTVLENSLECAGDAQFTPPLFELKRLKSLSFYSCFPKSARRRLATIPSHGWEKLAGTLESLEFRSNPALGGGVPAGVGRLSGLRSLVLAENALAGELPRELGGLTRLRRMVLSGNNFCGRIPDSLGYAMAAGLLILDLSRNALTGPLPESLGRLGSLLKLDLSNNRIDGELPPGLGSLGNLTLLDLRNNRLSGGIEASLHGMASLQDMLLSNNSLGGALAGFPWAAMGELVNVDLSNNGFSGRIPADSMADLRNLRFLALNNNDLVGDVPAKLAALPTVAALYLHGNNLTGRLEFSGEFYRRMGRRFAAWGNPNLCYSAAAAGGTAHAPAGVPRCRREEEGRSSTGTTWKSNAWDGSPGQSSASLGFPASAGGSRRMGKAGVVVVVAALGFLINLVL